MSELIDLGIARGLIEKNGNHLSFAGSDLGNGRERSRETLTNSPELQSTLRQATDRVAGRRLASEPKPSQGESK